jgi:hypothetical protein
MPIGAFKLNTLARKLSSVTNSITATGGDSISYFLSSSILYKIHNFATAGTSSFVVSAITGTPTVDVLIIGGGGGGGSGTNFGAGAGGGGGGGQIILSTAKPITTGTFSLTIGTAGTAGSNNKGGDGGTTSGLSLSAGGGGGGGAGLSSGSNVAPSNGTGGGAGGVSSNAASSGGQGGNPTALAGNTASGTTGGAGYTITNFNSTSTVYGGGGAAGGGTGGTGSTNPGGGGGGGTSSGSNIAGNAGRAGAVYIRYPVTQVTSISYITSVTATNNSTITWPTIQAGDLAIYINTAINSTASTPGFNAGPSGFTSIAGGTVTVATTLGGRVNYDYKICTGSESGTNITNTTGTNSTYTTLLIYRGNIPINNIIATINQAQGTDSAPTSQTLAMSGVTGPYVACAMFTSSGNVTTRGSSITATREIANSTHQYVQTFESTSSGVSFSSSTISMADYGTNFLVNFICQVQ